MVTTDKVFAGSIPEIYDRYLVPLIFDSYAVDLAERVATTDPRDVLETAAGTGVLTRAIASRLPAYARIVATDLNQPMLNHAKARQSHDGRIEWKQADALALPFEDQSFDVVACQFGVMFFPDKVQGYKEARRVLKPGGQFLFNVWDRISENEFADIVTEALAALFPHDPPRFMDRTPHGYHDVERIRAELNAAGFVDISVDAVDGRSKASSPLDPAIAYCQGTPLRNEIEARDASRLEDATKQVAETLAHRFHRRSHPSVRDHRHSLTWRRQRLGLPVWVKSAGPAKGRGGSAAFPIPDHFLHCGTPRLRAKFRTHALQQTVCMETYSIKSSARMRRDSGNSSPSALAVLRLMKNSTLVGCSTGRSAGFVPLTIRSM